jgi:hypothetical protein
MNTDLFIALALGICRHVSRYADDYVWLLIKP